MKILYLHGIGSGADSRTPRELRKDFPDAEIFAPELPVSPKAAYEYICSLNEDYDLVIGTSLGGFYTLTAFPMTRKLLINPALFADTDIEKGIGYGKQPFFCERSNGATEYEIDEKYIAELKCLRDKIYRERDILFPDRLEHNLLNETYALFGMNDALLHHYDDFCTIFLKEHAYTCGAQHRLSTDEIHCILTPLIKRILAEPPIPFCVIMDDLDSL